MNSQQLLKHFDRLAEAPDAVPRLRRFILDLAVRGKLVEQDVNREVCNFIPEIIPASLPLDVPRSWRWTEFGMVGHISGGYAFRSTDYSSSGVFVLRVTNIEPSGLINQNDPVFLPPEKVTEELKRFYLNEGDILLVMVGGSLGKIGVVTSSVLPALLNQNLWRITPAGDQVFGPFLKLLTDFAVSFQQKITHSTHGHLSREEFRTKPVALPPLAEQKRIVARVDELMGLCDRLEAAQKEREERRDRLAAASLHRLNQPDDNAKTFQAHARFHLRHLPRLTTRPDQIPALRQTILNLAVRGKLVHQDPNDEPASLFIRAIKNEKKHLIQQKVIKLSNSHTHRGNAPETAKLPSNWEWVILDEITDIGTGSTPSKANREYYRDGTVPWVTSSATNNEFITAPEHFVTQSAVKECRLNLYPTGSLIVALYGQGKTRGQVGQLMFDSTTNQACAVVVFFGSGVLARDYIRLVLKKKYHEMREMAAGGPQPNLSGGLIRNTNIPLPPIAEQKRIVAKVDELMAVCDQLESELTTAQTESRRLLEAVLHEALKPVDKTSCD